MKQGIITGKFILRVTDTLYKFLGEGQICYITTKYPVTKLNEQVHLNVKLFPKLFLGMNRYKLLKIIPNKIYSNTRKHITRKIKTLNEYSRLDMENGQTMFSSKTTGAGSSAVTPRRSKQGGKPKASLEKMTRIITAKL